MQKLGLGEKVKSFSYLMTGSDMEVTKINISLQRLDNSEFDYRFQLLIVEKPGTPNPVLLDHGVKGKKLAALEEVMEMRGVVQLEVRVVPNWSVSTWC